MSGFAQLWTLVAAADPDAAARADLALAAARRRVPGTALLTTCQRVELYGWGECPDLPGFQAMRGEAAAGHLLRVATGLESAVVGEPEILQQVRAAYRQAGHLPAPLARIFDAAIAAGRRARSGRGPTAGGLASAAAAHLLQTARPGPLLVAGAGYMGTALAAALAGRGRPLLIASRDRARAASVAVRFSAGAASLLEAALLAPQVGGVAVALSGPWQELEGGPALPPTVDLSAPPAVPVAVRGGYADIDAVLRLAPAGAGADYRRRAEAIVAATLAGLAVRERVPL